MDGEEKWGGSGSASWGREWVRGKARGRVVKDKIMGFLCLN